MNNTKKYHIITFGCQMNERDSETLAGFLEERGYEPIDSHREADLVLINTCSVRENADQRFFGTLGQLKKHKEQDPSFIVGVCGCMMQQQPIIDAIKAKYPWVDIIFGTHNIHAFPELLDKTIDQQMATDYHNKTLIDVWTEGEDFVEGMPYKPLYEYKSFVNIMLGCNNFCTYCIVPYTRGRERSRKAEYVVAEVERLVANGVKEVTLLGQNVNSYRSEGRDFADLLHMLDEVEGLERIRFMTSHPKDLSDRLIDAFRECKHVCHYIHLPVQSGSTRILKKMNRRYSREDYLALVKKLRAAVPDICISTDIIVGFPGETEEDFQDTLSLVDEVGYDSAFTFLYSKRQGTPAATYEDQVPEDVKHERFDRLVDLVNMHSARINKGYEGKVYDVLVEGASKRDGDALSGRTDGFKLVNFQGPEEIAGTTVKVRITEGKTFSLVGELLSEN